MESNCQEIPGNAKQAFIDFRIFSRSNCLFKTNNLNLFIESQELIVLMK